MMLMIETQTYNEAMPASLLGKYAFMETASATKIAEAVCPSEIKDVIEVLDNFVLTSRLMLTKGGSRGPIPRLLDDAFTRRGWYEARVDLYKRAFLFPGQNMASAKDDPFGEAAAKYLVSETYQQGYSVDNVKGRIALDVEWNPKDGNLDRDFAAYRAWHEEGLIDVAVLITRMHDDTRTIADSAWKEFIERNPSMSAAEQTVSYSTTTTANYEKARERILRGDLGTCPILMVGIGAKAWDRRPWDGKIVKYDKAAGQLMLCDAFDEETPSVPYPWLIH